jgi:quinol monooxygenase YgiN
MFPEILLYSNESENEICRPVEIDLDSMDSEAVFRTRRMEKQGNRIRARVLAAAAIWSLDAGALHAQETDKTVGRIAELVIDPAQLNAYMTAVKEETEDAIRLEPGALGIYSGAEKEKPNHLRFFEIYASEEAYRAHIESTHFRKYVALTQRMIRARKLIETVPVEFSDKA